MNTRKALLFARDPGAANTVIPLVSPLQERGVDVLLVGKDAAKSRFALFQLPFQELAEELRLSTSQCRWREENVDLFARFLQDNQVDLVVTGTGSDDFSEKYLWLAARRRGIPSLAILDHWLNFGVRFSRFPLLELARYEENKEHDCVPTIICVLDASVKHEMVEQGFSPEIIQVTGQPYFDLLLRQAQAVQPERVDEFREKVMEFPKDGKLLSFISENISEAEKGQDLEKYFWGYTERFELENVLRVVKNLSGKHPPITLLVRPHPNEVLDVYSDLLCSKRGKHFSVVLDRKADPFVLMKASDLLIGMTSMFLIEGAILGRPILSVQVGLSRPDPFVLSTRGYAPSVLDLVTLRQRFEDFFAGKELPGKPFSISPGSTQKVMHILEGWL